MTQTISQNSVIIEHNGSSTWLRLNRPDRLNAVNAAVIEELIDGLIAACDRGSSSRDCADFLPVAWWPRDQHNGSLTRRERRRTFGSTLQNPP